MKLKFKKEVSLGMEITSHRVDKDEHVFTFTFDSKLYYDNGKLTDSVEYRIHNVLYDNWFSDYPYIPNTDNDVNLWEENYSIFNLLFEDEAKYDKIIQEMCIEYCKEHNLPNSLLDMYNMYSIYHGPIYLTTVILDNIKVSNIDNDKIYTGFYRKDAPYYEIKFTIYNNKLKLDNEIVNIEFDTIDNTNDDTFSNSLNEACFKFVTIWNDRILGKFDCDRYQEYLDKQK